MNRKLQQYCIKNCKKRQLSDMKSQSFCWFRFKNFALSLSLLISFAYTTGANICNDIIKPPSTSQQQLYLSSIFHKNIYPDSRLITSPMFHLLDRAKDASKCIQTCCRNDTCRSVFLYDSKCFLVLCSFIASHPSTCPSRFLMDKPNSNWTWVNVKEDANLTLTEVPQFQDKQVVLDESNNININSSSRTFIEHSTSTTTTTATTDEPTFGSSQHALQSPSSETTASTPSVLEYVSTLSTILLTTRKATLWVVSAGESRTIRLPENNITLFATIAPEPADGEKNSYAYKWVMISSPPGGEMGHMDDMMSSSLKLTFLPVGNYSLKVVVSKGNQSNEAFVNVTVLAAARKNKPPVAVVIPVEQKLNQQNSLVIDGSASKDDDKILSYKWELVSGPASASITPETDVNSPILNIRVLAPGLYKFRLTVMDSDSVSNSTEASVNVIKEIDYPPKANAGSNQILQLPTNYITLYGNASSDDKGIVSYEWTKISNDLATDMVGVRSPFLQLSNLQVGDYTFKLTVKDEANQVNEAEVHVIVNPAQNQPPVADAGMNQTFWLPLDEVVLNASNSTDDSKVVSYHWSIVSGPDRATIENADKAVTRLLNPKLGVYLIEVKIADAMGLEATSKVYVTIKQNPNTPPIANAGGDLIVEMNERLVVIVNGSRSSDDRGIMSYQWTREPKSPAAGEPVMDSDKSAILQLVDLVTGQYVWMLEVTDGDGLSSKDRMTLTVKEDPRKDELVRVILQVKVETFSNVYKSSVQSHLEDVMKKYLKSKVIKVHIRKLSPDPVNGRTVIDFYVESSSEGTPQHLKRHISDEIESIIRKELASGLSVDFEFPIVQIFALVCHRNCSGHGYCDETTRRCVCNDFWMSNFFKANYGEKETNCDWSILYVFIIVTGIFLFFLLVGCIVGKKLRKRCRPIQKQGSVKKRHRYTLLDETSSNGVKMNGNAHHNPHRDHHHNLFNDNPRFRSSKTSGDLSDSCSSSEEMIYLKSNNYHKLYPIRRNTIDSSEVAIGATNSDNDVKKLSNEDTVVEMSPNNGAIH